VNRGGKSSWRSPGGDSAPSGFIRIWSANSAPRSATTACDGSCGVWEKLVNCLSVAWSVRRARKPRSTSAKGLRSSLRKASGGVPKILVIDNLRAAVKHPDWYDPELNPKLQAFSEHYGVVIIPTKPYTPRHKGKVERGVGYAQDNGLKGHTFDSLEAENRHLLCWEENIADTRIHGTTKKQVGKVFGLAESLDVRLQEASGNQLNHAEFLEPILQDELLVRQQRLIARRTKAARFRELKTLDEFDWSFNPKIPKKRIFDLATCRFIREARDFLHDEALAGEEKVLTKYLKPDLLIIDDMGMKRLPKQSGEYLFEIIMRRYELRSTIMTSNRPLEDWGKLIGDVPAATAILDRFLHHAELITITGQSYRLRHQSSSPDGASNGSKPAIAPTGSEPSESQPAGGKAGRSRRNRKTATPKVVEACQS